MPALRAASNIVEFLGACTVCPLIVKVTISIILPPLTLNYCLKRACRHAGTAFNAFCGINNVLAALLAADSLNRALACAQAAALAQILDNGQLRPFAASSCRGYKVNYQGLQ